VVVVEAVVDERGRLFIYKRTLPVVVGIVKRESCPEMSRLKKALALAMTCVDW
jgi:hypothetical protein